MEENKKIDVPETDPVEYEDVKRLPLAAFIAIGIVFGVAMGFSAGNLLFGGNFLLGTAVCLAIGVVGGLILGLVNKNKKKPE